MCNVALNDGQSTIKMFFFDIYEWFAFTIINRCRFGYGKHLHLHYHYHYYYHYISHKYLWRRRTFSLIKATEKVIIYLIWFEIFRRDTKCGTTNACLDGDTKFEQNEIWNKNAKHIEARIQFAFILLATVVWIAESFSYFSSLSYRFPHPRNVSFHMYIYFLHLLFVR